MASPTSELLPYRPNVYEPLTLADLVAICGICSTQVELWWMLEPYVTAHSWDEDDILVIWYDVRASIAQEASQRPLQGVEEQKAQPEGKPGKAWAKKGWMKFRRFLKKMKRSL